MATIDEVKKIVRSLLVSAPLKVTVFTLNKDYKELEGFYIPFKELGYNSLLHFLHSIPDVLRVNGTSHHSEVTLVVSEKIAHVNDLVMKQKKPSKGKKALIPKKSVIINSRNSIRTHTLKKINIGVDEYSNLNNQGPSQSALTIPKALFPFPRPLLNTPKASHSVINSMNEEELCSESYENEGVEVKSTLEIQPRTEKLKLIKQRLSKGKVLREQNFFGNDKNVTIIFGNDRITSEKGIVNIEVDEKCSKIPEEIKINLQTLISKYPHGLLCSELPSEYEKLYKKELNFEKYGFACLIRLCMTLENIFHWEKESTFDFKLYDRRKPIPKIRICSNDNSLETPANTNIEEIDPLSIIAIESRDWDEHLEFIPEDALKLGQQIIKSCVNDFIIGNRVPIVVSAISDPGKFWVYKDDGVLDKMMNSMQSYYRDNKAAYLIPEFLLEVGLYCVVHTLGEFQRGLIVDLLSNIGGYVKVYFVDYGTLDNIPREKIWFLSKQFSILPAYAIRGKLSDIEPLKGVWNKQSTLRFRDFVSAKHVFARISMIEEQLITVHIADFRSPLKFLNDVLVEEGYASYITKPTHTEMAGTPGTKRDISKLLDRIKMKRIGHSTLDNKDP